MPFSLADCILNSSDPEKRRRPGRETVKTPTPAPVSHPTAEGSEAKAGVPAQGSPAGSTPAQSLSLAALGELRALLGDLSSEWRGVVEAFQEFKKALEDEKGQIVVAPPKKAAGPPPQALSQAGPPAASPAQAAPLSVTKLKTQMAPATRPPSAEKAEKKDPVEETIKPDPPETAERDSGDKGGPVPHPEIDAKLGELLKLLKDSVAARTSSSGVQTVEIPKNLTLEIAREVAGRVRDSVLASIRLVSSSPDSSNETGPTAKEKPRDAPQKRIPLDDVSALIDQITGQG